MRLVMIIAAAVALAAVPAQAGGPFDGPYGGLQIGKAFNADVQLKENIPTSPIIPAPFNVPLTSSTDLDGVLGGLHLGVRKKTGAIVYGVEARLNGGNLDGNNGNCLGLTGIASNAGFPASASCSTDVNWVASMVAKLGVAKGRWHAYGLLGYAVADVDHRIDININLGPGFGLSSGVNETASGLAFGAGFEYALAKEWSIGLEFTRYDLEASGSGLVLGGVVSSGDRDLRHDTLFARVTRSF